MNLLLLKILSIYIEGEILILSYFFILGAGKVVEEEYPFRLYSFVVSMLRFLARPSPLKNPKESFYYLLMLLQALMPLLVRIEEM